MIDYSWSPGTIGEFERLGHLAQANRGFLQDVADTSGAGLLGRAVAVGTLKLRDLAAGASPVDTGTLRSSHRGEVDAFGGGVEGTVFIDPSARNPVNRGQPAVYGEIWAMFYGNWFERVADMHGETILDDMEHIVLERVSDLWL
ncbi:MAG TPA: hypothetical protein PKE20_00090 [Promineifilum sp.]|nr:hypothetical protein [Promineifilum sp.]